ncbi:MAG TPA: DNA-formamidopyrimidine glycosylase family protein [Solirubrobacteraceae bacterium]|nr:DNA-formamidopyrimidine glycosylase family protein [Solirubrobacteraceae bacterium]
MPEGDTIHHAARRIRPVLEGRVPDAIETPHPRLQGDRWPQRLAGRAVTDVSARGKHLLLRFEGGLAIHSHLRMTGAWAVHLPGERPRRGAHRAWLRLRSGDAEVVQFDGPVLELLTEARLRLDPRLTGLGPDILDDELDLPEVLRRLRADDPTRPIGDALLDQRTIAGIGNMWKCEGCFLARVDPWRPTGEVGDEEVARIVELTRPGMLQSARDGRQDRHRVVYGAAGRPCPRCGEIVRRRGQGDGNRPTFWCPGCQA